MERSGVIEHRQRLRAVVAFPLLEADDRQWIESIRAKHDPEAKRIAEHFTLVFPAVLPLRAMEAHVSRVAALTEPIRFALRRAVVVPDAHGSGGHVFLFAEDGRDALSGLHERTFHSDPLHNHPEPHYPLPVKSPHFIPHLELICPDQRCDGSPASSAYP